MGVRPLMIQAASPQDNRSARKFLLLPGHSLLRTTKDFAVLIMNGIALY